MPNNERTVGFMLSAGDDREKDAAYWLKLAEDDVRKDLTMLLADIQRIPMEHRGDLLDVAKNMLYHLDEMTKLVKAGFGIQPPQKPPVAGNADDADNEDMESKVKALEDFATQARDRLVRIETRLDSMATKEDLHKELHGMTWKLIGVATALVGAVFFIARTVTP